VFAYPARALANQAFRLLGVRTTTFKSCHFPPGIVLTCIRGYCRFKRSYREIEERMARRDKAAALRSNRVRVRPARMPPIRSSLW